MADTIVVMNQGVIEQARRAAGGLRPAGQRVRRRLHRLAGDELHAARRRLCAPATRPGAAGRCAVAVPALGRGRADGGCCSACGPSTCASPTTRRCAPRCWAAEYLGTQPDRHLRPTPGVIKRVRRQRRDVPVERGDRSAWRSTPGTVVAVRRGQRAALRQRDRRAGPPRERDAPWLSSASARRRASASATSHARARLDLDVADGEFIVLLGPERRRQDDDAAPGRRPGDSPTPAACTSAAST